VSGLHHLRHIQEFRKPQQHIEMFEPRACIPCHSVTCLELALLDPLHGNTKQSYEGSQKCSQALAFGSIRKIVLTNHPLCHVDVVLLNNDQDQTIVITLMGSLVLYRELSPLASTISE
jgi:hypothetical protein